MLSGGDEKMKNAERAGEQFGQLVHLIETLRSDRGCPWDREQDERSIVNYFLSEVYEAVEAVTVDDPVSLAEELGDILMEIVFLAQIYRERSKFSVVDVLKGINKKMIRRHPHVFSDTKKATAREVYDGWLKSKKEEKKRESVFNGFPKSAPSLQAAFQMGMLVSHYGFDWGKPLDALQKVKEEIFELERVVESLDRKQISQEMGDVFFSLANVARLLGINPEICLRLSNKKFIKRFKYIEKKLKEEKKELGEASLEEMDKIWEESKDNIK
ncbi:MAG: nucleoside triphosphate pyrophosphohydrolase [Candidatus Aminicenantaceae bacterium]